MMNENQSLPAALEEIVELFEESTGTEKIELLVDYAQRMPPLPARLAEKSQDMDRVEECMTPVAVVAESEDGRLNFYFDVPEESPTVRGFASLMADGVRGCTPDEILAIPADFYLRMGLQDVLTYQRLNGLSAILAHMKRLAVSSIKI